jgi:hypothetical protein
LGDLTEPPDDMRLHPTSLNLSYAALSDTFRARYLRPRSGILFAWISAVASSRRRGVCFESGGCGSTIVSPSARLFVSYYDSGFTFVVETERLSIDGESLTRIGPIELVHYREYK